MPYHMMISMTIQTVKVMNIAYWPGLLSVRYSRNSWSRGESSCIRLQSAESGAKLYRCATAGLEKVSFSILKAKYNIIPILHNGNGQGRPRFSIIMYLLPNLECGLFLPHGRLLNEGIHV
jgi:hypothetical protein